MSDRDLMLAHIARSEKGFVNTEYKRYLSRMPVALSIVKLGYSQDVHQVEPLLARPLLMPGEEPTDAEIAERFY